MNGVRRVARSRTRKSTKRLLRDHGADILSIVAGVGVVTTGVLAYNGGKAAILQDDDDLSNKERILKRGRILAPTIISAGITIACIGGSRHLGKLRERDLVSACALLSNYIQAQSESNGGEAGIKRSEESNRTVEYSDIEDTGTGEIVFRETFTGRMFKSSMANVKMALSRLQDNFSICGIALLNDLYDFVGIEETQAGEVLAWTTDQMVMDPDYIEGNDFSYDEALTTLAIQLQKVEDNFYDIHYNILPVGSLAGIGPCNY